jgi:tryptophan synthase beta chain
MWKSCGTNYLRIIYEDSFQQEFKALLKDYVGRPSPLFHGKKAE